MEILILITVIVAISLFFLFVLAVVMTRVKRIDGKLLKVDLVSHFALIQCKGRKIKLLSGLEGLEKKLLQSLVTKKAEVEIVYLQTKIGKLNLRHSFGLFEKKRSF
ncbi:MAG TPA: hypothetical protein PLE26_02180 [Candidatus Paceibacterota bacterium]|nr:hypothetical protein [Candidatus Paceibacterota bacterium]HQB56866.1 hypothetical protein [Candidatus Paceibacterota bacterium]